MKFVDLKFPGVLHEELQTNKDAAYQELRLNIEDAWSVAPDPMQKRFKELSGTNYIAYRGLIFELYILKTLISSGFQVSYEFNGSESLGSIDFMAEKGLNKLLVEVTSLGPNEDGIRNPNFDIDSEGFLKVRNTLRKKLSKVSEPPKFPTILALSDSHESFLSTTFERIQVLYGVPAVRFNPDTEESALVFADKGIWAEEPLRTQGYSAAYFTRGKYPGFSFLGRPELWLNPSANIEIEPGAWPEDVIYFKSDERLHRTSKDIHFEWAVLNSIY